MEKNIPLMLDSTILKQVPKLNSELFNELIKYTRANLYSLYISEIVEQEFVSWARDEAQNAYDAVTKATKSLNKYYEEPSIFGLKLDFSATIMIAGNEINGILKKVTENWVSFKEKTNVTVIPILPEHGKIVMDAYFSGGKPFSNVKNRSDIPDAFIFCSLNEILRSNEKVVFVSGDKKFTRAIQCETIICFESLSDLFSSGPVKLDSRFFKSLEGNNKFISLTRIYEDEIHRKLVKELEFSDLSDIFGEEFIEKAIGEYSDMSVNVMEINKKYSEAKSISALSYLVSFEARLKCTIDSYATKDEVILVNVQRLENIDKEVDDDGNFKIAESRFYSVSGHFSVKFDDSDPSSWKEQENDKLFKMREIKEITVALEDIKQNA